MKAKKRIIGGREYWVIGSTTEMERGRGVSQSYTSYEGVITIQAGKVVHPNGVVTDTEGVLLHDQPYVLG